MSAVRNCYSTLLLLYLINYVLFLKDFTLSEYDEIHMEEVTSGTGNALSSGSSNLPSPEKKQVKKRSVKKRKATKGLASVADDVSIFVIAEEFFILIQF